VALATAKANLARDQAQLNTAKANLARSKELLAAGVVAQQDYDTQEASAGQFAGTVQADKAAIDNAKLNLVYTHIISPMDGRIGLRLIDPGNMVHATDANGMLVVTQMRPIAVVFTLPEDQLPEVLKQSHKGTLKVDAYSRDDQTVLASGKLETVDNQIDVTTGTAKLKAVFDNKDGALWPNQFVNIHMQLSTAKDALVIPMAAVQRGPDGNLAYVVGTDKKVTIQPVTIALTQGNIALISSGLQEGQQVVTEGQDKLQTGSVVSPKNTILPKSGAPANAQEVPQGAPQGKKGPKTVLVDSAPNAPRTAENMGGAR
jgi:multidrug efflux system membrane fusion protein